MKIKARGRTPKNAASQNTQRGFWQYSRFIGILLFAYTILVYTAGLISSEFQIVDSRTLIASTRQFPTLLSNRISGLFANPDHLHIEIKHKHFQKLAYKRKVALMIGRLITEEDDYVPAVIRKNNVAYNAKLRLKGDWLDHLEGDKWSYRVKLKDDAAIDGLRVFSIQHPKTRNFLAEWLYHEALRREDILSLRYDFVQASVNGKNLGIFAIEEHFNKILVENNRRREGPIIRLSEGMVWNQLDELTTNPQIVPFSSASYNAVSIDAFESSNISADSVQQKLFVKALSLFEAFRQGKRPAHEVFDVNKLATFLALSELMGAHHSAIWNNTRFYYNPITARLEPIGFDGKAGSHLEISAASLKKSDLSATRLDLFYHALKDSIFEGKYLQQLNRVSNPTYLSNLLDEVAPLLEKKLAILHKEFPSYSFPYEIIEQNRRLLQFTLYPADPVRAHVLNHTADSLFLEIGSTQALPVHLKHLTVGTDHQILFEPDFFLPGRQPERAISFTETGFALPNTLRLSSSKLDSLFVGFSIKGTDSLRTTGVMPYPHLENSYVWNDLTGKPANVGDFPFLIEDNQNKVVAVKEGKWLVDKNLILPEGFLFRAEGEITFDLINDAVILARGPLFFEGSLEHPVIVTSSDSTGQGVVVLNAKGLSHISNTNFDNLKSVDQFGWSLPGSVTFHESEVHMQEVLFSDSFAEDALNIVRTSFQLDSVRFHSNASDAFDADFAEGTISHSVFLDSGNDGIDASGSKLTLDTVEIKNAGDKGFSAGEYSFINGKNLTISDSKIALASKDKSVVKLSNISIANSEIGVAVFQKKPEFGPASLECDDLSMQDVNIDALIEEGSLFMMNQRLFHPNEKSVAEKLYGNFNSTSSD